MTGSFSSLVYKFSFLLALMASFFVAFANSAQAEVLFSDGFETDFSEWNIPGAQWRIITSSGAHPPSTKRAHAEGPSLGSVLTKNVSTAGYEDISISFWYKVSGLEAVDGDEIEVDYSADGGVTWENDIVIFRDETGDNVTTWTEFIADLGEEANDNPNFILRFRLATNTGNDYFDLDDVVIVGEEMPVVLDEDGDRIIEGDYCPGTTADVSGSDKFNPNHWRYDGSILVKALTGKGKGNSSAYTMSDTRGCGCDQMLDILMTETGEEYGGQRKFGCTAGTIEEFMELIW